MSDVEKEFEEWWMNAPQTVMDVESPYRWAKKAYLAAHRKQEERVRKLETDLKLNASLLAKQCDMARDAEAYNKRFRRAIEKHKDTVMNWHTDMFPEDE